MVEINLLPWRENLRKKKNRKKIVVFYVTSVVMTFLLFLPLRFYLLQQLDYYKTNNAMQVRKITNTPEQEENNLRWEAMLRHQSVIFSLLNLFGSLHETIALSDIFCKDKIIQINGEADLFVDVKKLMSELLAVPHVDYVKLVALNSASGRLQFQLQLMEQ